MDNNVQRIKEEVIQINKRLEKQNSLSYNFVLAIVRGFGTVIGATVVFAIIISILSKISETFGDLPLLERLLLLITEQ